MGTVIVTGGSRGIGAAIALLLGEAGHQVCVNYLSNAEAAASVVRRITEAGGTALAVRADTSREAEIEGLFAEVDRRMAPLTGLVNNAGVLDRQCRVDEMDEDRINRILRTNITGPLLCAKQAILRMSTRYGGQGGSIVNISSIAARRGGAGEYVDYAASKGAVDALGNGLALEVAAEGIRVNTVRPGLIDTEIHAEGRLDRLTGAIPLGRAGQPHEVAEAVLWLLSDRASYTTGAVLDVGGGR
ncbi:SDR family oxidoreductase [Pseudonocardiaceae bacterium YIM PH 21723]|nr:SDR family oxidoreductase [Pseudonocardiaceae bacterium YIM PH 21723]